MQSMEPETIASASVPPAPDCQRKPPVLDCSAGGRVRRRRRFLLWGVVCLTTGAGLWAFVVPSPIPKQYAHYEHCARNLREIGGAVRQYAAQNGGAYPQRLDQLVASGMLPPEYLVCQASRDTVAAGPNPQELAANVRKEGHCSYVYVGAGLTNATVTPEHVIAFERRPHNDETKHYILYGDGTVGRAPVQQVLDELATSSRIPKEK